MDRLGLSKCVLAVLLTVAAALPAGAQMANIDYIGYAFETGGLLPSNAGDELTLVAVASNADPVFEVDLGAYELTFHAGGLISTGEVLDGSTTVIHYTGGMLEIYQDGSQDADWGLNPPNAVSPATFTDGELFFRGEFSSFTLYFAPGGYGTFEGTLSALDGTMIDGSCSDCVYTWAGAFLSGAGAQNPAGYDLQTDGGFQIDSTVATETASWGSVKALFSN